ncbi:MAG: ferritin-like domain-containing protein, partial [Acidimicrobiales bacterium]
MRRKQREIEISNAELAAMTKSMDELHYDQSVPALNKAVAEWQETMAGERAADPAARSGATSRRHFLLGAGGLVAGGAILAACGSSGGSSTTTSTAGGTSSTGGAPSSSGSLSSADAGSMAVDASIENLAIFAYEAGIKAATAGKLGSVPPAVPVFAETALAHHKQHLAAFNAVLVSGGKKAVMVPEPVLTPVVKKKFAAVNDVVGLAELAVLLENVAA